MGLVRLFLALVVAADHWRIIVSPGLATAPLDDRFKLGFNGGYAVFFFYVVSGFLITYTLTRNYTRDAAGVREFYRQRAIRIYALYWPMVLLSFLLVDGSWAMFMSGSPLDKLTGLLLLGMDWSLAFATYPQSNWAATVFRLPQAWTLGAELTFYVLAPFLLRSWQATLTALVASFAARAAIVAALGPSLHEVWTYHFAGTTFGFFLLGMLAGRAADRSDVLRRRWIWVPALIGSAGVMALGDLQGPFDSPRLWFSVLLFTLCLPGLFEATRRMRWMNATGNLSYPIYLSHLMIIALMSGWIVQLAPPLAGHPPYAAVGLFLAVTVVLSAIVHRLIEVPAAGLLRARWVRHDARNMP